MIRTAVVGGWPAGCTAAYTLRKNGYQVSLFEAQDHVGGRTSQVLENGFNLGTGALFLMGGIYPRTNAILKELGRYNELVPWDAKAAVIDTDGKRYTAGDYFAHAGVEAAVFSGELAASRLIQAHRDATLAPRWTPPGNFTHKQRCLRERMTAGRLRRPVPALRSIATASASALVVPSGLRSRRVSSRPSIRRVPHGRSSPDQRSGPRARQAGHRPGVTAPVHRLEGPYARCSLASPWPGSEGMRGQSPRVTRYTR
jgi:phytoene dehydrogenase-like protein